MFGWWVGLLGGSEWSHPDTHNTTTQPICLEDGPQEGLYVSTWLMASSRVVLGFPHGDVGF